MTKTKAIPHFLFWLTPLALLIILTGCKEEPPCDGPECPIQQQSAVMDQIDEMGKAADGKDFIAAPPVGWKDPVQAAMMKEFREEVAKKASTREVENGKIVAETTK